MTLSPCTCNEPEKLLSGIGDEACPTLDGDDDVAEFVRNLSGQQGSGKASESGTQNQ